MNRLCAGGCKSIIIDEIVHSIQPHYPRTFRSGRLPVKSGEAGRGKVSDGMEQMVHRIFEKRVAEGKPTRDPQIRKIALDVAESMGINLQKFEASKGWVYDWKKRFKVTLRTITKVGRKLTPTEEDIVRTVQ